MIRNKTIVLGVTGSIAAYKAAEIASQLTQAGAKVNVIMTEEAIQFISPVTFRAITGRPVVTEMFDLASEFSIEHVSLARAADIVVLPYLSGVSASAVLKTAIGYAKPIICSDLPTFQEEITHGVNGILVRPNDDKALTQALLKLLSDDGLKEKFAKELKRTAGQQLWSSVAKDTFELYLRLSGGSQDGIA